MKATGTLKEPSIDYMTGKTVIAIQVNEDVREQLQELIGKPKLDVEIKMHREKRSLNANAYFHVLVDKIAKKTGTSSTCQKNRMIAEYGEFEIDDDGKPSYIILRDDIDYLEIAWLHLFPTQKTQQLDNGALHRVYLVRRGSHTYNTYEMAKLIDGTVSEAKELGIETLLPDELERMKLSWQNN